MSVVVILEFKVKDDAWETVRDGLRSILPDTVKFEGCEAVKAAVDEPSRTIVLYEEWAALENQQKYMAWRESRGELAPLRAALREPFAPRVMEVLRF